MSAEIVRRHLANSEWRLAEVAALALLDQAVEPHERGLVLAMLSRANFRLGRPARALKYGEEAAALTEHWEISLSVGEAMLAVGDPLVARTLLQQAVDKLSQIEAPLEAVVGLQVALSLALRASGQAEAGVAVAGRALAVARASRDAAPSELSSAWYALAVCYHASGQVEESLQAINRCLAIRKETVPDSTDVALALDAKAAILRQIREPFESVKLHHDALKIWIDTLGEHASPVGGCRHSLAQSLHRTGDFFGAREQMAQALRITVRNFGPDHVDSWITRFELGRFEVDTGEMEEGFARMEEARKAVILALGDSHPVVIAMNRWL